MVFFICNGCGESVKKAQAEKHKYICRNCTCLSCIDCGKDFWGEAYKTHVKCISEDQKYGGKGYEAKANKGDVKQQQWIQKVHEAINKQNVNPKVRSILKQIEFYDNIPRKKAKFQNWMKNSLKISNADLQDQVWEVFSAAVNSESSNQQQGNKHQVSESPPADTDDGEELVSEEESQDCKGDKKEEIQKKKKERKESHFENQDFDTEKIEHKIHSVENGVSERDTDKNSEGDRHSAKKKKKRKRQDSQNQEDSKESIETSVIGKMTEEMADESMKNTETEKKKKKNKKKTQLEDEIADISFEARRVEEDISSHKKHRKHKNKRQEDESDGPLVSQNLEDHDSSTVVEENEEEQRGKFNWKGTIKAVLKKAPDNELSIKKLKKKVLAQYYTVTGDANWRTENEVLSIFNKKIKSNPKFKVFKDKVKLAR
ncbi:cell growth-regulating nucleolar protein [Protopterus annectens]|uniref:cell growth-regulating nucleolar protein n=1 Tax=Protopterus annectens TaxID=7888 RepID=UPI001CFAA64B|nr:cell growth-regulating nucleolar protein [Protopterus annectens]XP_043918539.1 cell growth-regulating nucleolar protein [Protopterus annectens]